MLPVQKDTLIIHHMYSLKFQTAISIPDDSLCHLKLIIRNFLLMLYVYSVTYGSRGRNLASSLIWVNFTRDHKISREERDHEDIILKKLAEQALEKMPRL